MHCKHKKIGWIFDQNLDHSLLKYKNDEQIACGDLYPKTLTNSINRNLFEYPWTISMQTKNLHALTTQSPSIYYLV